MIAPTDFPPDPERGRIMLDGYRNVLIWENSRIILTPEEKAEAEYLKSIASYSAPWNPEVGKKWLNLNTNRLMVHLGHATWYFDRSPPGLSDIKVDRPLYSWTAYQPQQMQYTPTPEQVEILNKAVVKPSPKPAPEEPEPPKKSRVFTFE